MNITLSPYNIPEINTEIIENLNKRRDESLCDDEGKVLKYRRISIEEDYRHSTKEMIDLTGEPDEIPVIDLTDDLEPIEIDLSSPEKIDVLSKVKFIEIDSSFWNTPKKGFKIKVTNDENGYPRFKVCVSPNTKKMQGVVYMFKNNRKKKYYVGKTEQLVQKRLYGYQQSLRDSSKNRKIIRAIRKNPGDFTFHVFPLDSVYGRELDRLEIRGIKEKSGYAEGYNHDRGGGGPKSKKKKPSIVKKIVF